MADDERSAKLHELLDAMLSRREVQVPNPPLGHLTTTIVEIRSSGTVAVKGSRLSTILSFEPGQVEVVES